MFDPNQKIQMRLVRPEGDVVVELVFPDDEAWKARQDKKKVIVVELGRGKTREEALGAEADAEMVQRFIQQPEDGELVVLSEAEAVRVIAAISEVAVLEFERRGDSFEIEIEDFREISYRLLVKVPTADQLEAYRRDLVRHRTLATNKRSYAINLGAVTDLWLQISQDAWVPLPWRSVILRQVMDAINDLAVVRENPL